MVHLETPTQEDLNLINSLLQKHVSHTQSPLASTILTHWLTESNHFLKIYPIEYKRAIEQKLRSSNVLAL